MKKTLIALAVLAASGASFAQVTISGNLTMGYQANTNAGANGAGSNDSAGFGVDTSEIDFAATEDLGGGWKAIAKLALAGADRSGESGVTAAGASSGGVTGRNASLSLVTTGGVVTLASTRAADYLSGGIAGVGAYYSGWDGKVFSGRTNRDVVSYTLPLGAFSLATSYQETSVQANQGLGVGTTGAPGVTGQSLVTLGGDYNQGPVSANFTYLNFNAKEQDPTIAAAVLTRDQTRLSGSYNFGVAKVGLGAVVTNLTNIVPTRANPKMTDLLLGVSVPFGALTVGVEFAQRKMDDMLYAVGVDRSGTVTGSSLQVSYDLSKRTSLIANYARWTQATTTIGGAAAPGLTPGQDASSQYQFLVSHSF